MRRITYRERLEGISPSSPHGKRWGRMDSIGDLIGKVVQNSGLGKRNSLETLQKAWREAVGREAAQSTRLKSFRGGTLTVEVDSAALAQELGVYHKRELLERLRAEARVPLQDIRFRVVGGGCEGGDNPTVLG